MYITERETGCSESEILAMFGNNSSTGWVTFPFERPAGAVKMLVVR